MLQLHILKVQDKIVLEDKSLRKTTQVMYGTYAKKVWIGQEMTVKRVFAILMHQIDATINIAAVGWSKCALSM